MMIQCNKTEITKYWKFLRRYWKRGQPEISTGLLTSTEDQGVIAIMKVMINQDQV